MGKFLQIFHSFISFSRRQDLIARFIATLHQLLSYPYPRIPDEFQYHQFRAEAEIYLLGFIPVPVPVFSPQGSEPFKQIVTTGQLAFSSFAVCIDIYAVRRTLYWVGVPGSDFLTALMSADELKPPVDAPSPPARKIKILEIVAHCGRLETEGPVPAYVVLIKVLLVKQPGNVQFLRMLLYTTASAKGRSSIKVAPRFWIQMKSEVMRSPLYTGLFPKLSNLDFKERFLPLFKWHANVFKCSLLMNAGRTRRTHNTAEGYFVVIRRTVPRKYLIPNKYPPDRSGGMGLGST